MVGFSLTSLIEPAMFTGIGFLIACLLATAIFPAVHARAARLTAREIYDKIPQSVIEVAADRDQMRAEFAMAIKRLESRIAMLRDKVVAYADELKRKTIMCDRLRSAFDEKSKLALALEVRESALIMREQSLVDELLALRSERQRHIDGLLAKTSSPLDPPRRHPVPEWG